ncbi:MAG: L,D-transpeptidase family protein, partial [Bdellovibrionales bacterium]|nr:L,D-transpeptidase family protein [Bdellovibrionales bacterium]
MALFVPMMRFFFLPAFLITVYFVCAKPVSASPGVITFQRAARASEFRPIFERLPLRPTAAQALQEVLSSGAGRVIRSWNAKNLIHTSHALKQSLSEHGLEVLFPLAEVFDGVADRDGPLRQEESVLLTGAVANIFDRFLFGHLSHEHLGKSVNKSLRVHSLKQAISRFLGGESLDNLFYEGQPGWDLYQLSVNALRDAKSYSDKDLNRLVPSRAVMKVGYCSQEIVLFAKALSLLGFGDFGEMTTLRARLKTRQIYIPSLAPFSFFVFGKSRDVYRDAFCFNDAMSEATRRFQETSSNGATGAMDFATATSLRSALVHWEDTIRVNMDRMRWIRKPDSGGMILVNVPAFELHAYENSREQLTMKVVVGDRLTSTPLFEDSMEYIIFRPLWWVPQSILQGELLAEVIKDPLYLQKYGFSAELNGKSISGYQVATLATRAGGRVPGLSMTQL